jgi:hypothetical protein
LERQKETLLATLEKTILEKKAVDEKLKASNDGLAALLEVQKQLDEESQKFASLQTDENKV